jgi:hypothetical protein
MNETPSSGTSGHAETARALAAALGAHEAILAKSPDGEIRMWNVVDGVAFPVFKVRDQYPIILALEPDARRIAVRSEDTIELWRGGNEPMPLHTFRSLTTPTCAASPSSAASAASGWA